MQFSDDSLEEFQRIWKRDYGREITKEEARVYGERLVNFFKILMDMDQKPQSGVSQSLNAQEHLS